LAGPACDSILDREERGFLMEISISEEVQTQLDQVKEWMESKIGRDVTYNDVILQILKNFQSVLYPEDLGRA
jgi:predicted transcriptional regulator